MLLMTMILYNVGPRIIHSSNQERTPSVVIESNKDLYYELADEVMEGAADAEKKKEQVDSLYLWFHVRGINMDDGDEAVGIMNKWRMLWNQNRENYSSTY